MRKIYFLCMLLLVNGLINQIKAQAIASYDFQSLSGSYTPNSGSATAVAGVVGDDSYSTATVPLGFTFKYGGVDYTSVKVNSNGFITFGSGAGTTTQQRTNNAANSAIVGPAVFPLWDDLIGFTAAPASSEATYELTGTPGSQVVTIEWKNWLWNYTGTNSPANISFQVKLYEGTNVIEFVYNPEAGAATGTRGATIGLGGSSASDYLVLDNTLSSASFSSFTSDINTAPTSGQIFQFTPPPPAAFDAQLQRLILPTALCPSASAPVSVRIKNNGTNPIDFSTNSANITVDIAGTSTQSLSASVNTGTLAVGDSLTVSLTNADLSVGGVHQFTASVSLNGDNDFYNDTLRVNKTIATVVTTPHLEEFSAPPAGWTATTGWYVGTTIPGNPGNSAYSELYYSTNSQITTVSMGPVAANEKLTFDYKLEDYYNGNYPGAGWGYFLLQVSTDCGGTFTTIDSVYSGSASWQEKGYSLSAYVGQTVTFRMLAKWLSGDFYLAFDNVKVDVPPAIDLVSTAVNVPASNCPNNSVPVSVTIKNNASDPIDFSLNPATVTVDIAGASTQTLTATINTGTLAVDATQTIAVTPSADFSIGGTHNITAFVTVSGDGNVVNDTAKLNKTIAEAPVATPHEETFDAGTTLPTGWAEEEFYFGTSVAGNGGNSAYVNLYDWGTTYGSLTSVGMGPILATDALSFDYKLANYTGGGQVPSNWGYYLVKISTDCGGTFTTIDSVYANPNSWSNKSYPLSAYVGQNIVVKFEGNYNIASGGDFYLAFDNFRVQVPPSMDVTPVSITLPSGACTNSTAPISVVVKNVGLDPIDFSTNSLSVNVDIAGASTQTLTGNVTTGTLAPNATVSIPVTNADFTLGGEYNLTAYVTLAGDGMVSNDTVRADKAIYEGNITASPVNEDFSSAVDPTDWDINDWTIDVIRGTAGATGLTDNSLSYNLWSSDPTAQFSTGVIGPVAATDVLSFDYKLSLYSSSSSYGPVPTGWGYYLVKISTDCGGSFTTLDSVYANPNTWTNKSYPLTSYSGQNVLVKIEAEWLTSDFDLSFDNFVVGNAMPVTLSDFNGVRVGNINKLTWTTKTEVNNAGFELQRSADGRNFTKLGYVAAKSENGNSTRELNYSFNDTKPYAGVSYYRLNQVDKDGKSTLSNVVAIKGDKLNEIQFSAVYPNPAKDRLNVVLASPKAERVTLVVTDLSGKVIKQQMHNATEGNNNIEVNVNSLSAGTYIIKLVCASGCETAVQKFMKN